MSLKIFIFICVSCKGDVLQFIVVVGIKKAEIFPLQMFIWALSTLSSQIYYSYSSLSTFHEKVLLMFKILQRLLGKLPLFW